MEKLTLIGLEIAFLIAAFLIGDRLPPLEGWLLFVALGFASFRAGRAIAFNYIFKWIRTPFDIEEVPHSSGAGSDNHAKGVGYKKAIGELLCCPICSGTWAVLVLLGLSNLPIGRALIWALAAAGVAEVLHWFSLTFEWGGHLSRELTGMYNRRNKDDQQITYRFTSRSESHGFDKVGSHSGDGGHSIPR